MTTVDERLTIDPTQSVIIRDFHPNEFIPEFLKDYNATTRIFFEGVPYGARKPKGVELYSLNKRTEKLKLIEKWPEFIGEDNYHLHDPSTSRLHKVNELFGKGARTKLNVSDLELWTAYWAILDLFEGAGIATYKNDIRIPSRGMYLHAYDPTIFNYDFCLENSKEEVEKEIRMQMYPKHCLLKWLEQGISDWIDQEPDHLYSVNFLGPYITIDRKSDIKMLAYLAMKENHPILERLERMNLI